MSEGKTSFVHCNNGGRSKKDILHIFEQFDEKLSFPDKETVAVDTTSPPKFSAKVCRQAVVLTAILVLHQNPFSASVIMAT